MSQGNQLDHCPCCTGTSFQVSLDIPRKHSKPDKKGAGAQHKHPHKKRFAIDTVGKSPLRLLQKNAQKPSNKLSPPKQVKDAVEVADTISFLDIHKAKFLSNHASLLLSVALVLKSHNTPNVVTFDGGKQQSSLKRLWRFQLRNTSARRSGTRTVVQMRLGHAIDHFHHRHGHGLSHSHNFFSSIVLWLSPGRSGNELVVQS